MKKIDIALFAGFSLAYILTIFLLPENTDVLERYNLTTTQANLLSLTVIIPYILIWFAALYGYSRLREYTETIPDTKDGEALTIVAKGLRILAYSLPLITLVGRFGSSLSSMNENNTPVITVITNYVGLILVVSAFYYISLGAKKLTEIPKKKLATPRMDTLYMVMATALSFGFIFITLTNPARQYPTVNSAGEAAYYMNDFLLILTIVIPYIYVWFSGMNAAKYFHQYAISVSGKLYKNGLKTLGRGLLFVVFSLIALRYLASLNTIISGAALNMLLLIVYALLTLIASGYVMIAIGSRKLKMIEEV